MFQGIKNVFMSTPGSRHHTKCLHLYRKMSGPDFTAVLLAIGEHYKPEHLHVTPARLERIVAYAHTKAESGAANAHDWEIEVGRLSAAKVVAMERWQDLRANYLYVDTPTLINPKEDPAVVPCEPPFATPAPGS